VKREKPTGITNMSNSLQWMNLLKWVLVARRSSYRYATEWPCALTSTFSFPTGGEAERSLTCAGHTLLTTWNFTCHSVMNFILSDACCWPYNLRYRKSSSIYRTYSVALDKSVPMLTLASSPVSRAKIGFLGIKFLAWCGKALCICSLYLQVILYCEISPMI